MALKLARIDDSNLYHGVPVLELHADDPVPTPRAPIRYAMRITPDLARYFLTFNHPDNRRLRTRKVAQMASDMRADRWRFTPESIVFSATGVLQNGQNRLVAVTEFGGPVWIMVDFGWPDDIITAIDRASARTNQDAMKVSGMMHSAGVASAVTGVWRYDRTVGTTRGWSGLPIPSSLESIEIVNANPEAWLRAAQVGYRAYRTLAKGGGATLWTVCHFLIERVHPDKVELFFNEFIEGAGAPGSPTRELDEWFRRRPVSATKTGDGREPYELVIRGFNAWQSGRQFKKVQLAGFELSRIR